MEATTIINIIVCTFAALYYWVESIFLFFFPPARKVVRGQIVLITGAGSGIGQKLSIKFAKLDCKVVGFDVSEAGLESTKKKLAELGFSKHWYSFQCDVTDRNHVQELAKKVQEEVGDVSILINNAGIVTGKNFNECSDELMQKTMDVNTTAHFWTNKAFLPKMLANDKGHIVTIASGAGLFGIPGLVDYCASKFGAVGLAEALHYELTYIKKTGIKSTLVCPYFIDTGMFDGVTSPIIPIIKTDEAADLIVDAILREKIHLFIPRLVYVMYAMRGLLPDKSMFILAKAFGVLDRMETFVGRKKRNE